MKLPVTGAQVFPNYGMVGVCGHADRPSHSFAPIRRDRDIGLVRHFSEMFVPADALLAERDAALRS